MKPRARGFALGLLSIVIGEGPLLAQEAAPPRANGEAPSASAGEAGPAGQTQERPEPTSNEVAELRETVQQLESRLAQLEAAQLEARKQEAPRGEQPLGPSRAGLSDQPNAMNRRQSFREDHHASPRPGNAASAAELQGFFPVGDTGLWLKLGGYAKLDVILDSAAMGNPNKFATSSIYTESDAAYDPSLHFNMHGKQSRLGFEARTGTKFGSLRVVYENDFFGDGLGPSMTYNLRHLYGQLGNLTVGQTWTPYLDSDAIPDTLDFAGPGVQAIRRSPQVRYTVPFSDTLHLALAIEQPGSDIAGLPTGAAARNVAPDFTFALRAESERLGHVHLGGLARAIAYEDATGDLSATFGWSTNVSGALNTFGKDHLVLNATVGQGTGHYAQDLVNSAALVTSGGGLDALLTVGGFAGYRHLWADAWTSQVTYGYLALEEHSDLAAASYRETHYAQANLVWSPEKRLHVGLEYLYGYKSTQDGASGDDHRGQLSFKFSLF